ncbi:Hydrocephalus-inducing protein-like [Papilio machaon]|uniref:Hydrocephalus-inducing protein-like n=1 Tax=Papilio machaon TaxID=76193 RepID=A0A194QSA7_PAPMA|nr:Hydrocephalus-inducing protein-like [Papilio machaon]
MSEAQEFVPVHCNKLKGYVEGGTSTDVVFSFSPPAPGVYESQWKFIIPIHSLVINLLVVGFVRESNVVFVPTILLIRNSLVGFTSENVVKLKNNEDECLTFEFKGNSLCDESGETPVVIMPERGILKPHSETPINIIYTPIYDGPLSFKIFCSIKHLTKVLTLCVNALSYSIKPIVTYYLIGNEHTLKSEAVTNIHLDKTASTYERTVPFVIKNDGSATFFFEWHYSSTPVKKYLKVDIEPSIGHVTPGNQVECILHFNLKQVPVHAFPVTLSIVDGPEYEIYLHAEIEKPKYHFSCMEFDFGKCIVNAPETTYKKNIAFENSDEVPLTIDLNFSNLPELYVQYNKEYAVEPRGRMKISIYFRPKEVKVYEFKLQFWVNTLCEEIVTIRGEGVPLLFDLYDGCQKSFDLGPVKVGDKIVRQIEVMNHSKVPIDASFSFKDTYALVDDTNKSEATSICLGFRASVQGSDPGHDRDEMLKAYKEDKIQEQIALDIQNALSSLKVIPNKCTIQPYHKVPLKIQFKPVGIMTKLNVQPLKTAEFTISPIEGNIAARTDVTFTVTFRPANNNPFIKVWASCNIENYKPLELALYATCIDAGAVQNKTIIMECPVREIQTEHLVVTNPTDEMWLVLSEVTGDAFTTLKEFNVEANTTYDIPIYFKPKYFGKHEGQVLYSPLGESALFINLIGIATHPNPNGNLSLIVKEKDVHTEELLVYNITEFPESYIVTSEIVKIFPDKYEGYYEIKHPDTIKVWGEATAICRWSFVCYEQCEMEAKVTFTNEETREYQFYNITITVIPSGIKGTMIFESRARESVQKELSIFNPLSTEAEFNIHCEQHIRTDEMWLVLSEVTGDAFTTLKEFNVEANTTFDIPIYFKPKYFGKHEGQVLYSPLGESALFINLIGIATHPNPNGNLSLIVKEKDVHTEELLVYNITEFPESYIVTSEIVKIFPDKYEGYYEIKHPDTIKVWGEATAICRWSLVCYEQCEMEAKVTFTNEETREYQFYNITITVIPSGIKGTMIFESRARESVQKELSIFNPLSTEAEFNIHCENLDSCEVIKINRNSKAPITLTYAPLVVGETEEYLQVFNPLVGAYMYKVTLICLPAKEKNLEFTTSIGSSVPLRLRVQNKTDLKTEFNITVSHPSIIIDEKYALGPFEKGKVQAWFEPIEIGCQDCRVSLNSPTAGEFVYNIKGIGTKPKPQGPYLVKRGDFTTITFKNVFMDTRTFKFSVDQEEFYLKSVYETVKPKKELYLPVYLIQTPDDEVPTGCLTIETHEPSEPKVQWTFFLQGVP